MIVDDKILMKWNSYNKKYYTNLNYKFTKMGDFFEINICDLNKNSHYEVNIKCDICNKKIKRKYKNYNECIKNKGFYCCSSCRFHKTKLTNMERYNVENISELNYIKDILKEKTKKDYPNRKLKSEKTNLIKYGCKNPFQNKEIIEKIKIKTKQTKIKKGLISPDNLKSDYDLYKQKIINETRKHKIKLFEKWDGLDYYDNEYIQDNFKYNHMNSLYPNIDHKMSIKYGFDNNIPTDDISHYDNLCITKKKNNNKKGIKNEKDFIL